MLLLAFLCWLCLVNSFLAHPLNQYKEPNLQSDPADYPDLTHGLTDAEVRETLNDLTLEDLKSVDHLILENADNREEESTAGLGPQSVQVMKKTLRAVNPTMEDGCREENDCGEAKQVSRSKPCPSPTSKCCVKTTRPTTPDCTTKASCGSTDVFNKCPKINNKNKRKKFQDDIECESDDFQCLARKQIENTKKILQELDLSVDIPSKYTSPRELAGIETIMNYQGQPLDEALNLDFPKESRPMEPAELHGNLATSKPESLANIYQRHSSFEGKHQSHLEQANDKFQYEKNLNRENDVGANSKQTSQADVQPEILGNFQLDQWFKMKQGFSDNVALRNWAKLNPANLANIEQANWDAELTNWANVELNHQPQFSQEHYANSQLGKQANFQPAQEQQATNQYHFRQDNQASLELGNQGISQQENRANIQLQNQDSFKQTHRNYHQADLNSDQVHQQDRELRPDVSYHQSTEQGELKAERAPLEVYEGHQLSRKRNACQENQDLKPQGQTHRQQRSEVNYHPLERYGEHQLSRKRNAYQKSLPLKPQGQTHRQQRSEVSYHPNTEQWTLNQPLKKQAKIEPTSLEPYEGHQFSRKRNDEEQQVNPNQEGQALISQGQTQIQQRSEVNYHLNTEQAELNGVEGEPAPLEPYEGHQFSRKRNAEIEKSTQGRGKIVTNNDKPQPVNAYMAKQESHSDVDSFISNSARDPPRYLNSKQSDLIQRQNERRLNEDRSLSESLNLDKLTGEKEPNPAGESDWSSDNKRGKRENSPKATDDAPENHKETYLKKLMDSFPRDQGSQINANVALKDLPFAHERMKRS
ncbi:bromodomain-containing protein DDB_G0280777 isoform X2 [Drosophila kikkawai]|uniref:Bromodomain-containing protein DDB_G0280777 isoform X2 n=1 Tax=Drosophila kikkawai TaxID=30033 RepID=A0ABM3C5Y9_DROKI|nr:probable serine/threonine-protein kinase DDB_G0280133 isoform X2 [Drosophila kikkawai]